MRCHVIGKECEYYSCQRDRNGDIVSEHCHHTGNGPSGLEDNCRTKSCPLDKPSYLMQCVDMLDYLHSEKQLAKRRLYDAYTDARCNFVKGCESSIVEAFIWEYAGGGPEYWHDLHMDLSNAGIYEKISNSDGEWSEAEAGVL